MRNAIFEVWCWKFSNTGCFSNMLLELIAKADSSNKERLRMSFPGEVAAFEMWHEKGDEWLRSMKWNEPKTNVVKQYKGEPA